VASRGEVGGSGGREDKVGVRWEEWPLRGGLSGERIREWKVLASTTLVVEVIRFICTLSVIVD